MAQFRELAAFAQFGSDLDARTKQQLERGSRVVELFKQPEFSPKPAEVQVSLLWAMQNGLFDSIDVKKIVEAKDSLEEFLCTRKKSVVDAILQTGKLTEEIEGQLKEACEEWKRTFSA